MHRANAKKKKLLKPKSEQCINPNIDPERLE